MRLNIGSTYVGTISAIEKYGAVIQFEDGSTHLLHISHISDTYVTNIADFLNVGETISVLAIPGKIKPVELTTRQSEINEYENQEGKSFEELLDFYPPNDKDIRYKDRSLPWKRSKRGGKKHK